MTRLLRWVEQQLCAHVSVLTVCSLLGLAHVYESAELEHNCLKFMKVSTRVSRPYKCYTASTHRWPHGFRDSLPLTPYLLTYFTCMKTNANAVVQRPEFATLANAALVKFHMFCAGVEGADEAGKKRKREATSE